MEIIKGLGLDDNIDSEEHDWRESIGRHFVDIRDSDQTASVFTDHGMDELNSIAGEKFGQEFEEDKMLLKQVKTYFAAEDKHIKVLAAWVLPEQDLAVTKRTYMDNPPRYVIEKLSVARQDYIQ